MSDDDYSSFSEVRSFHEKRFKAFREIDAAEQLLRYLSLSPEKLVHEIFGKSTAPDLAAEFHGDRWIAIEVYEIFNPDRRKAIEHNHRIQSTPPQNSKPRKVPRSEVSVPNYQIWTIASFVEAVDKALAVKEEKLLPVRNSGKFKKVILNLYTEEATLSPELVESSIEHLSCKAINIDECYVQFGMTASEQDDPFVRLF